MRDNLVQKFNSPSKNILTTLAKSLKYKVSRHMDDFQLSNLADVIDDYIRLADHQDIEVKRFVIESLVTVTHCQPQLIRPKAELIVLITHNNKFKKEYIVEIDLGPFKHKNDEGKGLRQAAYQLLLVVLNEFAEKYPSSTAIEIVLEGLVDPDPDCQQSAFQILTRLIAIAPGIIMGQLGNILDLTKKIIEVQKKQSATNVTNLLRVAVKTIIDLKALPEIDTNSIYQEFYNLLLKDNQIASLMTESY